MLDRITAYRQCLEQPDDWAVATVVSVSGSSPAPVGTSMAVSADLEIIGSLSGGCVESTTASIAQECIIDQRADLETFGPDGGKLGEVPLTCGGQIQVLIQPLSTLAEYDYALALTQRPAVQAAQLQRRVTLETGDVVVDEERTAAPRLMLFGLQDYAVHVAQLGLNAGWDVHLVDPRPAFAAAHRIPQGATLTIDDPATVAATLGPGDDAVAAPNSAWTAACVMTHHPDLDIPVLDALLTTHASRDHDAVSSGVDFIGALGSRNSQHRRQEALMRRGHSRDALAYIHGPVGLDINAHTPVESAVSVFAQLIAAKNGNASQRPLDQLSGPIQHSRPRSASLLRPPRHFASTVGVG